MKNLLLAVLFVLAVGAGIFVWRQKTEFERLRLAAAAEKTAVENEKTTLEKEKAALKKTADDALKSNRELTEEIATLRAQAAAAANSGPAAPAGGGPRNPLESAVGAMGALDNPELQKVMAIERRAALNSRYASLFKNLHLDPERLDRLKTLLVEKEMANLDVLLAAAKEGINPMQDPQGFRRMVASTQADLDSKIKTTLGDDGYAQFQDYQRTQGQRVVVTQLEQNLSYTDTPLTPAQAEQVVRILAQSGTGRDSGGAPGSSSSSGANSRMGSRVSDEAIAQAQTVLSPAQVDALREIQQQQKAVQQAALLMLQGRSRPAPTPAQPETTR